MNAPLVSRIVPVFNGERYLAETLESILRQTYPRLELIEVSVTHIQSFWSEGLSNQAQGLSRHPLAPMPGYCTPAMLARRSVFTRIGTYDPALRTAACRDWFVRARERNVRFDPLPDVLVRRRWHGANVSRDAGKIDDYLRLVKRHLERQRGCVP